MKKRTLSRQIFVTDYDMQRLEELIETVRSTSSRDTRHIEELEQELHRAEVMASTGIPPDVITMNSQVILKDMDSGEELVYTLVFPPGGKSGEKKNFRACSDWHSHDWLPARRPHNVARTWWHQKITGQVNHLSA